MLVLLLGAIGAGLRVPGLSYLSGLPGFGALDYRTLSGGGFLPLRAGYVDGLLGTSLADQAAAGAQQPTALELDERAAAAGTDAAAVFAGSPAEGSTGSGSKAVNHPFTNDDMDSAVLISSLPFTARTDNRKASREDGDPDSCAPSGGTAWYSYTARRDSTLLTDTIGSDHATAIAVFTAGPGSRLRQVGCATGPTGNAQFGFGAKKGQRYLFQVTGLVTGGQLTFHLSAIGRTGLAYPEVSRPAAGQGARGAVVSGDGNHIAYNSVVGYDPTQKFEANKFGSGCRHSVQPDCPGQLYVVDRRTGQRSLISRNTSGAPSNGVSIGPSLSHDGRHVGFASKAGDLVADDTNGTWDYFVHDRQTGRTVRASVDSQGRQGTRPQHEDGRLPNVHGSKSGWLSPDGRFAVFESTHGELVVGDPVSDNSLDLFVHDLRTGVTTREATNVGHWAQGFTAQSRISRDGRYLAYLDAASEGCGKACLNVFVRDRVLRTTRMVSVGPDGPAVSSSDYGATLMLSASADGQVLAWSTNSPMGDSDDTDKGYDIFAVDLRDGRGPRRVSAPAPGVPQDTSPTSTEFYNTLSVSGDGTRVAFFSYARDLVPGDSNGVADAFLHELATGVTTRVSTSTAGEPGNGDTFGPGLSHDGHIVVFESESDNFVAGDTSLPDIFVHDLTGV